MVSYTDFDERFADSTIMEGYFFGSNFTVQVSIKCIAEVDAKDTHYHHRVPCNT